LQECIVAFLLILLQMGILQSGTLWLLNRKELFTASAVYISLNRTNYTITYRTARWKYQIDYTSPNILYFVH